MRYLNLLDSVSRVKAKKCFVYNNTIYFAVPSKLFPKALGPNGRNLKIISERLSKKVRIIRDAQDDLRSIERFVGAIVSPVEFVSLEVRGEDYVLTAGSRTRAATLIGRNKTRLEELSKIINSYFGKDLKIV